MLLGHWLEMRSIAQARGALSALADLLPDSAERVTTTGTEQSPDRRSRSGTWCWYGPARVPADGMVVEGRADVDESMITGESRAVNKELGDTVIAGAVASVGRLRVKVTATGDDTALSGIMRLVAAAQASGSRAQALADRAAAILFYVALAAGTITLFYWWAVGGDPERRPGADGNRPRNRLPPCAGPRDPAGHRASRRPWAPETGCWSRTAWRSSELAPRHRHLRQDGHADRGRAGPGLRRGRCASSLRLAAAVEADLEHPLLGGDRATEPAPCGASVPTAIGFEALGGPRGPGLGRRCRCLGRRPTPARRAVARSGSGRRGVGSPRAARSSTSSPTAGSSGRWPSRTRSGPSRAASAWTRSPARRPRRDDHRGQPGGRRLVARRLGIDEVAAQVLPADKAAAVQRFQHGGRRSPWSATA